MCPSHHTADGGFCPLALSLAPHSPCGPAAQDRQQSSRQGAVPQSFSVSPAMVYNQSRYGVQPGQALSLSLPQPWTRHWCVGLLRQRAMEPPLHARWQRADEMKGSVLALQPPYHFTGHSPVPMGRCHGFLLRKTAVEGLEKATLRAEEPLLPFHKTQVNSQHPSHMADNHL